MKEGKGRGTGGTGASIKCCRSPWLKPWDHQQVELHLAGKPFYSSVADANHLLTHWSRCLPESKAEKPLRDSVVHSPSRSWGSVKTGLLAAVVLTQVWCLLHPWIPGHAFMLFAVQNSVAACCGAVLCLPMIPSATCNISACQWLLGRLSLCFDEGNRSTVWTEHFTHRFSSVTSESIC